jgi:hypothetical protein
MTRSFTVTVSPINNQPTLDLLSNLTIAQDSGPQSVNLTGISTGAGNEIQNLSVTASSGNPALIPNPPVAYNSPNSTGILTFTPVAGASGSAVITVTVQDDGGTLNGGQNTLNRAFVVTVTNPASPLLSIIWANPVIIVSWSTNAANFTLQARDSFSAPWAAVTTNPFRAGTQFYVTNSPAAGNRFYRLTK